MAASFSHEAPAATNSIPTEHKVYVTNDDAAIPHVRPPGRQATSGERWEKFEADFGMREKTPSLIKGSLVTAKYQFDRTLFGMQEFVRDVQNAVSFDYELRSFGRFSSSTNRWIALPVPIPWWETMEKARLQSDIDLNVATGRAFVGVRLMLPLGD